MKLLGRINDLDVFGRAEEAVDCVKRESVRMVLFDKNDKIPLIYLRKNDYYKLPGGGIEKGESLSSTLEREIREEVGCSFQLITELGKFIETIGKEKIIQTSYGYLGRVKGEIAETSLTDEEINYGSELIWVDINRAIKLISGSKPKNYIGYFTKIREVAFLREAIEKL